MRSRFLGNSPFSWFRGAQSESPSRVPSFATVYVVLIVRTFPLVSSFVGATVTSGSAIEMDVILRAVLTGQFRLAAAAAFTFDVFSCLEVKMRPASKHPPQPGRIA